MKSWTISIHIYREHYEVRDDEAIMTWIFELLIMSIKEAKLSHTLLRMYMWFWAVPEFKRVDQGNITRTTACPMAVCVLAKFDINGRPMDMKYSTEFVFIFLSLCIQDR